MYECRVFYFATIGEITNLFMNILKPVEFYNTIFKTVQYSYLLTICILDGQHINCIKNGN